MLRHVIGEYLSKSFDYFLKDKSNKKSRSASLSRQRSRRKQNEKLSLKSLFSRDKSIELARKSNSKLEEDLAKKPNPNSQFDELDWFNSLRKG